MVKLKCNCSNKFHCTHSMSYHRVDINTMNYFEKYLMDRIRERDINCYIKEDSCYFANKNCNPNLKRCCMCSKESRKEGSHW